MTIVRPSTMDDVEYLSTRLKEEDVREVWTSHKHTAEQSLKLSFDNSQECLTIEENGEAIAMFGINAETVLGDKAIIWFLSSEKIKFMKTKFLRRSKDYVNMFLKQYSLLYNLIDDRNVASIKWLKSIGAKFAGKTMINGYPFQYFWFERTS